MRYFTVVGFIAVMVLGCDHVDGLDDDVGSDVDTDSDSDSDSDSDVDTDTDTDIENDTDTDIDADTDTDIGPDTDECTAPEGITGWGGPCHTDADCPFSTRCIILSNMDYAQGFCSVECCNFSTPDVAYCTDVADGMEVCNIGSSSDGISFDPPYHCMIACSTAADCPDGTDCVDSGGVQNICYGYAL